MHETRKSVSRRFFQLLLRAFPFDFRTNYGPEMEDVFHDQQRELEQRGGLMVFFRLWAETISGMFRTAPREHWDIFRQDCAYALRMMGKNPGFTAIAVLTLALGIGANSAIFSVVHSVLIRPLPYPNGQQLVFIREAAQKAGVDDIGFSVPEIKDFREQNGTLAGLVEYHEMSFTLFGHGDPDRVKTGVVSWNYFDFFGIRPLYGRTFLSKDDVIGTPPVLVLSYEYWKKKFGGDPHVVGKTFEMNDKVHTVVGVLPPIPQYPRDNDVYMPTSACPFRSGKAHIVNRDMHMMEVFGRTKPGVTVEKASADMATIASRLQSTYPKSYPANMGYTANASSLKEDLTSQARPTLLVLLGAAVFVLLIACANVANLTLSRMARRERELAVRTALGAGRSRLLRQLFTESFLLAFTGGVVGLFLAFGSLQLLTEFAARLTPRAREIHIDAGVLLFTLLIAVGTSIVFGTFSAIFSRANLTSGLKEGTAGSGHQRNRVRGALIVSQIAISFMLLIGAGLMLRSLFKMLQVNPGFVSDRVLAMKINFNWSKYGTSQQFAEGAKKLVDRIQTEPGVLSASVSSTYPLEREVLTGGPNTVGFQIEGHPLGPGEAPPLVDVVSATSDFFRTLGIPLLRGREFADNDDAKALQVAIVNQTFQRRFFPNEDPVGRRVTPDNGKHWVTIVGVVGDVRDLGLERAPTIQAYVPLAQNPNPGTLLVRTAADPMSMANQMNRAVHDVDSQTAVSNVQTLAEARADSVASPRVTASLLAIFAGLALLIAAAGIGGIMALTVSQRVREIGIRMALGAQPSKIMGMILGQGLLLSTLGVGIGAAGAFFLTGLVKSMLFEVEPTDPVTFAAVALVLIGAALIASFLPARRAAAIDPMIALRSE